MIYKICSKTIWGGCPECGQGMDGAGRVWGKLPWELGDGYRRVP